MFKKLKAEIMAFGERNNGHIGLIPVPKVKPVSIEVNYIPFEFSLGDEVLDIVTGIKGVIVGSTQWANNCNTFKLAHRKAGKDGQHQEDFSLDAPLLKLISNDSVDVEVDYQPFKHDLGDRVVCTIDGYEGIIMARCSWLAGCNNYCLKSNHLDGGGNSKDGLWVSEHMLELLHKNPYFAEVKNKEKPAWERPYTGGPVESVTNNRM